MKVLLVGGGGREHALAWCLRRSPRVSEIYCAPGNGGIAALAKCVPISAENVTLLVTFAKENGIDMTIVGPEAPLVLGIVDAFKREGLKIFGPSREGAALEGSKAFMKDFCRKYDIPTASSETFTDAKAAKDYIDAHALPIVVKADGLAAGKGVIICNTIEEARTAIDQIMLDRKFGEAGGRVIVEEFLEGEEASFIAICDGNHVLPMATSQDHKAAYDGDEGPNTGGMGAISPAAILDDDVRQKVMERIMFPTARGMVTEGMPFVGTLYAGLMIKDGEPKLLEFNVRFGDPETQALLMRLKTDIMDIFEAAVSGSLDKIQMRWDKRPAVCVVMASGGYPGGYEKGIPIQGLDSVAESGDRVVFHAGTKLEGGQMLTNGGRVLGVTALGDDVEGAIANAYDAVKKIGWDGAHYRSDIGGKALK